MFDAYAVYMVMVKTGSLDLSKLKLVPNELGNGFKFMHGETGELVGSTNFMRAGGKPHHRTGQMLPKSVIVDTTRVEPQYRGMGVGQHMYQQMASHFKTEGVQYMGTKVQHQPDFANKLDPRLRHDDLGAGRLWQRLADKGVARVGAPEGVPVMGYHIDLGAHGG